MTFGKLRRARAAVAAGLSLALVLAGVSERAAAQTAVNVTVNTTKHLAAIPPAGVGINTAVWDNNLMDAAVPGLAYAAGITAMRYPGGSTSDGYDWQTNSMDPGAGSYANPNNNFDAFMGLANKVGATPVITVNYGSNASGTGGGTPALAAAWVKYANVTHAYGVKYWEIGNEVYGNGEYGAAWETDLHAAHDPTTYGANVAQFAAAMKAVDPTIKVGAVLAAPGNWPDGQKPDWNSNVLAQCGSKIDFVIVHWYPQTPGTESDAGLLATPQTGPGIATMMTKLKALIAQYGGQNAANMQVLVTEMNSVSSNPGKQTTSVVNALFIADGLMTWLENGASNVDVWALFDQVVGGNASSSLYGSTNYGDYGILSSGGGGEPAADTPMPTYYGMQMLSKLGKPGDTMVSASASSSLLATHAVLRQDGNLSLLLINKDPANTTNAHVSVAGFTPASTATVYTYGEAGGTIATTNVTGMGAKFSVAAAPYSLTVVTLAPAGAAKPAFSIAANPASLTVAPSGTGSASIAVTATGGFTGPVAFAISGVPAGVTAAFTPASSTTATTLKLSAASTAAAGTSVMTITGTGTGTSGALTAKTTIALVVAPANAGDFALSANPASLTLAQGSSTTATIAVAPTNGFTGGVALTATGLPAGVTASLTPASATSAGTLTLTAGGTAAAGAGTVTITGTSGTLSHTLALPLSVTTAATSGGPAVFNGAISSNSAWFDEDDVAISTSTQITALTLTITVPADTVSYGGGYNTIGSQVSSTGGASGTSLVYTYTLAGGQVIWPGTYRFAAQMNGNGTAHNFAGDSWTVTYTLGGVTYTQSGKI